MHRCKIILIASVLILAIFTSEVLVFGSYITSSGTDRFVREAASASLLSIILLMYLQDLLVDKGGQYCDENLRSELSTIGALSFAVGLLALAVSAAVAI